MREKEEKRNRDKPKQGMFRRLESSSDDQQHGSKCSERDDVEDKIVNLQQAGRQVCCSAYRYLNPGAAPVLCL